MIEVQHLTKRYGRVTAVERRQLSRRARRNPRLPGPERRRQDDDHAHPDRLHAGHRGQGDRRRLRRLRAADRGQAADRLPAGNAAALSGHERRRVPRLRREDQRACRPPERRAADPDGRWSARASPTWPNRLCSKLSKGYRQRVGLAQAHHSQPGRADSRRADRRASIRSRSSKRASSSRSSPAITRSSSARTSFPKSRRPASASSSSTRATWWRVDTPDNLTARLRGSETMYVQVDASGADAGGALERSRRASPASPRPTAATARRLRSGKRARPRRPPRSRAGGRRPAAGACSSCGRCA